MYQPHEWLGRDFRDLLPTLANCGERVTIALTRPSGRSYGSGALRVVSVRSHEGHQHLILAYERYLPPHSQRRRRGSPKRGGRDGTQAS